MYRILVLGVWFTIRVFPIYGSGPMQSLSVVRPKAADRTVEGKSTDSRSRIRIKVFDGNGVEVQHTETIAESQNHTFMAGLKKPLESGQVVQAFWVTGAVEGGHSTPVTVAGPTVSSLAPSAECAVETNSGFIKPALNTITANDSEIKGNAPLTSGTVSLCVNGSRSDIKAAPSAAPAETIPFRNGAYDLFLDSKLSPADQLLLVVESPDKKIRLTNSTAVRSAPDACSGTLDANAITLDKALTNGTSEVGGKSNSVQNGTITACLNGVPLALDNGSTNEVKNGIFAFKLKDALKENQSVDLVISAVGRPAPVKTQFSVVAPKLGPVQLTAEPKEGQKTLYVNASASTDAQQVLAVYIDGRPVRLLDNAGNQTSAVPVDSSGDTAVQLVTALEGGQCVRVVEFAKGKRPQIKPDDLLCPNLDQKKEGKNGTPPSTQDRKGQQGDRNAQEAQGAFSPSPPTIASAFFDYGRIRTYLAAGTLFSYDGGTFSQPSVFLGLSAYRNWLWGGMKVLPTDPANSTNSNGTEESAKLGPKFQHVNRLMFDTFLEARLTTVPVAACVPTVSSPASGPSAAASSNRPQSSTCGAQPASSGTSSQVSLQTALASPKAGELIGGASLPFLVTTWSNGGRPFGFSVGPIAKVGFITPVGSQSTTSAQVIAPQPFYTSFGFGNRFGFHKLTYSTNISPELLSYVDVMVGRYSNLDYNPDPTTRYARPWRFALEGLIKVPSTPLYLGFSANVHQNFGLNGSKTVDKERDDLRFFFGTKIDAGKLFEAVGRTQ